MQERICRQPSMPLQVSKGTGQLLQRQYGPCMHRGSMRDCASPMHFMTSPGLIGGVVIGTHPLGEMYPQAPASVFRQQPGPVGPAGQKVGLQVMPRSVIDSEYGPIELSVRLKRMATFC